MYLMVEWRPLPPLVSGTVFSGRRKLVFFNLQALLPMRRPLLAAQYAPPSSPQVVSSPATVKVTAQRRLSAVEKEQALIVFLIFILRSYVQNVGTCL